MSARPSPAMIVAVLALLAALAGTALAAEPDATSSAVNKKTVKKIARKQANRAIDKRAPFAYALIEADGGVATSPSPKNLTSANVTAPTTGARCFQLPFTPGTASGNSLADVADDTIVSMDLVSPFIGCPADAEAEVRTVDAQTGLENEAFYIQFDR